MKRRNFLKMVGGGIVGSMAAVVGLVVVGKTVRVTKQEVVEDPLKYQGVDIWWDPMTETGKMCEVGTADKMQEIWRGCLRGPSKPDLMIIGDDVMDQWSWWRETRS